MSRADDRLKPGDVEAKAEQLKRLEQKRKQLQSDRGMLLKLPEFQRVMADIISKGGMFRSVMTGNSNTYHLSGRQDFAREIWAEMAAVNQALAFELLKPKFGETLEEA